MPRTHTTHPFFASRRTGSVPYIVPSTESATPQSSANGPQHQPPPHRVALRILAFDAHQGTASAAAAKAANSQSETLLAKITTTAASSTPFLVYASESIAISESVIRCAIANMFIGNTPIATIKGKNNWEPLDLSFLLASKESKAVQRIQCLLAFLDAQASSPERTIIFERKKLPTVSARVNWTQSSTIPTQNVVLLPGPMESSTASRFVHFSNKDLIHWKIGPYATQADIVMSCFPEALLVMSLLPHMANNEALVIKNVLDLLLMDATQLTKKMDAFAESISMRDMNKAWLAFSDSVTPVVTGHWGCGRFGGNRTHKFLQQWMAASESGIQRLDYAMFGDKPLTLFWKRILAAVAEKEWTVGKIVTQLLVRHKSMTADYEEFVARELGISGPS
ncbi:hypothetical protein BCR33DRAFT_711511 [Rhizoclosmatium globosum]|uniref:PARG catalytic Macro domain-containing protein n=1 Tax=Rhizoclosmatium globosum TaxID=329046 RepID=A0A1Y2D1J1_9FUNG|nr:hypothetical protein BCR33DRAFT_711511 [Rhizoclosmatium globosum]|eukprot:ORY53159.1 hypothetical protein BCR33DRAFT_711511 [Rhizoclosmatium globosum]